MAAFVHLFCQEMTVILSKAKACPERSRRGPASRKQLTVILNEVKDLLLAISASTEGGYTLIRA
jgi:hypothetical protein